MDSISSTNAGKYSDRPFNVAIIALLGLTCIVFALSQFLEPAAQARLMKENGIIENLSVVGYLLCVGAILWQGGYQYTRKFWYFSVVFLAFAARELDFDKRFTNFGVLKSKFFFHPDVSWWGKLIAALILVFILTALVKIMRNHGASFINEVFSFRWSPLVWCVGFAGSFLVISKSLDGLGRKLSGWGIADISDEADTIASMLEEAMEFAVPFFFVIAILYYFRRMAPKA